MTAPKEIVTFVSSQPSMFLEMNKDTVNPVNQSKLVAKICIYRQERENVLEQFAIGFELTPTRRSILFLVPSGASILTQTSSHGIEMQHQ